MCSTSTLYLWKRSIKFIPLQFGSFCCSKIASLAKGKKNEFNVNIVQFGPILSENCHTTVEMVTVMSPIAFGLPASL